MVNYSEDSIKTLIWHEHIRLRPGMYIGKLGDGASQDDGIYILIKEVIDNSIDEFMMGNGSKISLDITDNRVDIRDYGRGIPLGKLIDVASKMNTGAKYDSEAFQKSVGLNGVGLKAVNALSMDFIIQSFRNGEAKKIEFSKGIVIKEYDIEKTTEPNGTSVSYMADNEIFGNYRYNFDFIEKQLKNYSFLHTGLKLILNKTKTFYSENGLLDLINENVNSDVLYPIIHLKEENLEVALTHGSQYGEEIYSFVNGQNTTQGGTHVVALRESLSRIIKDFYNKDFEPDDIRTSMIVAMNIKIQEPVFESQTKTKLGSKDITIGGTSIRSYINDFLKKALDDYLHKNSETSQILLKKIQESEKERKAIAGIKKIARESAKKTSLNNSKLRDCKIHFNTRHENKSLTTIFITEGDSASGSITKSRDVQTQAVFSLKGKPLNTFNETKGVVYKNEEFNLLQAALNLEEGIENIRYNNVVIATDADDDGMHIRLLLITFFLKFFPEVIKTGHLHILQTPLFRVRNKKKTFYCYDSKEKEAAMREIGDNAEITRFKGLGEISPEEFKYFIDKNIRLEPVTLKKEDNIQDMLSFYMGKNTQDRQNFIIENLIIEEDFVN